MIDDGRMKLSKLLLIKAEQVNPLKEPKPLPFPTHPHPNYRHPFGLADGRNVLFAGSGDQFWWWAGDILKEAMQKLLAFKDIDAWRWQANHLCHQIEEFFGTPNYCACPALMWTGQYCHTSWYRSEELGQGVQNRIIDEALFPLPKPRSKSTSIPLGYKVALPGIPREKVAALILDASQLLFAHPGGSNRDDQRLLWTLSQREKRHSSPIPTT